ncbi:MAG: beta strand repeat-containing protein, partial [Gammaproteobacteria bacterium]
MTNARQSALHLAILLSFSPFASAVDYVYTTGNYVPGVTAPEPLGADDTLLITTGGTKIFNGVTFTNLGTVNWNADSLFLQSGTQVLNGGAWNIGGDLTLINNGGTTPTFSNTGVFRKTAGSGAAQIGSLAFINSGIIEAQAGTIDFTSANATFNAGSQFTGAGTTRILAGATFNGALTSTNLQLTGGTFSGGGAVINGDVDFTGGTFSGTWTIAADQVLHGVTGGSKILSGATLTNLGTFNWETTDSLFLQSGTDLDNQGTFHAAESVTIVNNGGTLPTFENNGVLSVAAGKTLSMGTVQFINNATIDVEGELALNGNNATFNAGSQFTGTGVVAVNTNATFNGAITASPTLSLRGGIFTGANDFSIGGNPEFLGGTITGQWTLAAGQTLTARDGASKILSGAAFTNLGTFNWETGNSLFLQSATDFDNQGTFHAAESMTIVNNGGTLPTFENNGVLSVAAGKTLSMGTVEFINNATIDVEGELALNGNNATFNAGSQFTGTGVVAVN